MSHLSLNILVRRDANETKEELFERIVSTAEEYFETVKRKIKKIGEMFLRKKELHSLQFCVKFKI